MTIPRPARSETYFQTYIDAAPDGDVVQTLAQQGQQIATAVAALEPDQGLARYAPGKWSVNEVLGHLADGERIFAYRLLWLARGGGDELPGFDQDPFVETGRFDRLTPPQLADELSIVRQASLSLLRTLPDLNWQAPVTIAGNAMTPAHIPWLMVGHERHHLAVLRQRYGLTSLPDLA